MLIVGFGCRKGVTEAQVRAAYDAAGTMADALATAERKAAEPGLVALARALNLPLLAVSEEAMAAAPAVTVSEASLRVAGVPSVAECSALAAAGPGARLIVPRIVVGPVTCAVAEGEANMNVLTLTSTRHSREGGNPPPARLRAPVWTPAFAGVTVFFDAQATLKRMRHFFTISERPLSRFISPSPGESP